jgi:hypothetical protein
LYYTSDELYEHCRDRHESCFVCKKYFKKAYEYFQDYDALAAHFRRDHFTCDVPSCLEKKFVVFPSALDLKVHEMEEHVKKGGQQRSFQRHALSINIDLQHGALQANQPATKKEWASSSRRRPPAAERLMSPTTEEALQFTATAKAASLSTNTTTASAIPLRKCQSRRYLHGQLIK